MKRFLSSLLILFSTSVSAENLPYVASCFEQDTVAIVDVGMSRAVVTYSNSIENCSSPVTVTITSENGISVDVTVIISDDETVIIEPLDPQYMSLPPEAQIPDGQKYEFHIVAGVL